MKMEIKIISKRLRIVLFNTIFICFFFFNSKAIIHPIIIGTDFSSKQNLCVGDTLRFIGDSTNFGYYGVIQGNVYNALQNSYDNFSITSFTNIATTYDHVLIVGDSSYFYDGMQPSLLVGGLYFNCGSIGLNVEKNSNQIEIYPNPTSSLLNIELSYSSAYFDNYRNVIVYNTLGEIFLKQKISSQSFNLNVSEFESGIYFVTITDNNVVQFSEKFIKE